MIKINDKYYIDADSNSYTLKEKINITSKDGEEKEGYKDLGHYVSLESCCCGLVKKETRHFISNSEEGSLKELIAKVKELEVMFKKQFGQV